MPSDSAYLHDVGGFRHDHTAPADRSAPAEGHTIHSRSTGSRNRRSPPPPPPPFSALAGSGLRGPFFLVADLAQSWEDSSAEACSRIFSRQGRAFHASWVIRRVRLRSSSKTALTRAANSAS